MQPARSAISAAKVGSEPATLSGTFRWLLCEMASPVGSLGQQRAKPLSLIGVRLNCDQPVGSSSSSPTTATRQSASARPRQ